MAQKPEVTFDKLFQKLYNVDLWVTAYECIAANPGNMTPGVDGETIDGMGMALIHEMIEQLKTSRYRPTPVRREYIAKPTGGKRPLGIPSYRDKLLQTVVKLVLEAIYEPTFSNNSHGFRPARSCHTALIQVKKMNGVRWWVEGDICGFFDTMDHDILLSILGKRITDQRFLHLIEQFLRVGYVDNWVYHKTYTGTPQGSTLSPVLSNIYLNELDQAMEAKIAAFNRGQVRRKRKEYTRVASRKTRAKKLARQTGDWTEYNTLAKQQLNIPASDAFDPDYRRLTYCRYADDFLIGVIGSKADALAVKTWLAEYLARELRLTLSEDKTLITNAQDRARFLGYDVKKWTGKRKVRLHTTKGVFVKRTTTQQLALLMPRDKVQAFIRNYGKPNNQWRGERRPGLLRFSELEILMTYNAELRGFLNFYALADNLTAVAGNILWMASSSFLRTLANKHKSTLTKVLRSMKRGPNEYVITLTKANGKPRDYRLFSSTRQLKRDPITQRNPDNKPNLWLYQGRTELGQRLLAETCEWCGLQPGRMHIEVHHVRKLKDLKGKTSWERQMIARRRKTMVLCVECHDELHVGTLSEKKKAKGRPESRILENGYVRFGGEFSET
jgi:group II intron reverse transcriptase/maturase